MSTSDDVKVLKQEVADLFAEDATADKLRSLQEMADQCNDLRHLKIFMVHLINITR